MASQLLARAPPPSILSFSSSFRNGLRSPSAAPIPRHINRRSAVVTAKIREIFMPALSSTMTEGKIVSWMKSEGDVLSRGESVVVVESDKADMDVETFYDGILAAIVVGEGETAPVGAPIGLLAESEEEIAEAKAQASAKSSFSSAASPPPPPPPPPSSDNSVPVARAPPPPVVSEGPRKIVATPQAKKLAKQHKMDLGSVAGSGPYGRITPADIEKAAGISPSVSKPSSVAPAAAPSVTPSPSPPPSATASASLPQIPGSTVVPFTTMQAAVSRNMVESLSVPTFRVGYPVITDALDALYAKVEKCVSLLFLR